MPQQPLLGDPQACDATTDGCSWCRKINIPCVGYGQKRYLFKNEAPKLKQRYDDHAPLVKKTNGQSNPQQQWGFMLGLVREPTSDLDRLTQAFVSKASPSIDISHQLVMNFGGFLAEVPRRLGVNEALDAAAGVLVTAYAGYCAGDLNPSAKTLVFMRNTDLTVNHYVGASEIIKHRGFSGPQDDFERLLLATLKGPVVINALFDSRIQFTPHEWQNLVLMGMDISTIDGDLIFCLAQVPSLMSRVEGARFQHIIPRDNTGDIQSDILCLLVEYQIILGKLRDRWERTKQNIVPAGFDSYEARRLLHCHHARMLAFGLSVGILVNCLRKNLNRASQVSISQESSQMSEEIVELAQMLVVYRPLGSIVFGFFLGIAWIGASDPELKEKIETIGMVYGEDMYSAKNSRSVQDEMVMCLERFALS
ncbi:uncharacterized protein KY384_005042 [Bacidia gigantensis]|uniref:uncharacterized protein n=1 Tax=Bacidia gigantensis TaxID=2732470 RepID=UPI001D0590A2|nr:uncharacterized protein KY384_005042 [Bacidia gigantensis]KAG8530539.1 hypothetical protein KY384_005042 [Bacidia gigantensis]